MFAEHARPGLAVQTEQALNAVMELEKTAHINKGRWLFQEINTMKKSETRQGMILLGATENNMRGWPDKGVLETS